MLAQRIKEAIAEVQDFPKPGISFKDITPILLNPSLTRDVVKAFAQHAKNQRADYIAGIDARGFLFGLAVAQELGIAFVPLRKKGKLPRPTFSENYQLEYGEASLSLHKNDISPNAKVLIHDDLLATGGTALAAKKLIEKAGALVCGFQFLVELDFLNGRKDLEPKKIYSLVHYQD
jgi:adenine phosphoribosyltransferase